MDSLKKVYKYLYYLERLSDSKFGEGDKLVKSFNNLSYRRYYIENMNNTFNKMDLFKTPILLENLYDNNNITFDIYSDYGTDIDTIDIHSEDFFENIKTMFEYIIQIDSLISNGEINDIDERLMLLHKMNLKIKFMEKLLLNFMNDDELMYKLLSKSEKI